VRKLGAPGRGLASLPLPGGAVVGALLATAAVTVYYQLVWAASVEAPFLDDYDAVLGFLTQWIDAESIRARWRLAFRPHNEHVLGVPHAWVVLTHAVTGRLDVRLLNLIGNGYLLLLLAALYAAFRRDATHGVRLAAFAPAVLFVFQPQHWSALLSPTISLSNAGVVALAAVAFAALERETRAAGALAARAALSAGLSQANGFLVWPIAPVVLLLRGRRRDALLWGVAAIAVLAAYFGGLGPTPHNASLFASLDRPDRVAAYALNLLGCAAGFSRTGVSLAAGAALLASFVALAARGLPRRSPALFGLILFVLASIAANALVRAHQGAGAPLLQPRYAFYSAVVLALTYLGWGVVLAGRPAGRRWQVGALTAGVAFCVASHASARQDVLDLSQRLSSGLEKWWSTGEGGLIHPDFRKASFFMLKGLDQGLIRLPENWVPRYLAAPERRAPPDAGTAVSQHLHALHQQDDLLIVSGWAVAGSNAHRQEVEVVLASPRGTVFYPALEVLRIDLPKHSDRLAVQLAPSGFRALISTSDLAPGDYRMGILVRKGETEHLTWRREAIAIAPATR
jgi:hypothetical protein